MTNIEIGIIVIASLIPIIALVVLLPKLKKKKSTPKVEEKPKLMEEKVEEPPAPTIPEPSKPTFNATAFSNEDFKGYLTEKSKRSDKPIRKEMGFSVPDFDDEMFDDFGFAGSRKKNESDQNKTIAEQIQDLSPELKALIIAGVLDKKDFD